MVESIASIIVRGLKRGLGDGLLGVAVFGSMVRGDSTERSDVDIFVLLNEVRLSCPSDYLIVRDGIYKMLREVLDVSKRDVSLVVYGLNDWMEGRITPLLIDIAWEAKVLFDMNGVLSRIFEKLRSATVKAGFKRVCIGWREYRWVKDEGASAIGWKIEVNPGDAILYEDEVKYRVKLALGSLAEACHHFQEGKWVVCVSYAQLAAEDSAKAIIAIFRIPRPVHDQSNELNEINEIIANYKDILNRIWENSNSLLRKLSEIAHGLAPHHARTTYGIPGEYITPPRMYNREIAEKLLRSSIEAVKIMVQFIGRFSNKIWKESYNEAMEEYKELEEHKEKLQL